MSVSYFVRYEISAMDLAAFLRHYSEKHVPILSRWPGIRRIVVHEALAWNDPMPVNRGQAVLMAEMTFDSAEAMMSALASEGRAEARRDMHGFPPFEGTVFHQAMTSRELFRAPDAD